MIVIDFYRESLVTIKKFYKSLSRILNLVVTLKNLENIKNKLCRNALKMNEDV